MNNYPAILTIAGSDSGGGAGIQADLKTITSLHGFGISVITALTAQNGAGVTGIHSVPPEFIALQYKTVREGFKISAAKTGMLSNAEIMEALASLLAERDFPLVIDPVCVSQSGYQLVEESAIETLRNKIIPLADLLTPNQPEAEVLSGMPIKSTEDVEKAAAKLRKLGAKAVLIKGGHFLEGEAGNDQTTMTDWLSLPDGSLLPLQHHRVNTTNNHGTGCTISSAIATYLGRGYALPEAVRLAQAYLLRALEKSFSIGIGAGPVNFMAGAKLDQSLV